MQHCKSSEHFLDNMRKKKQICSSEGGENVHKEALFPKYLLN